MTIFSSRQPVFNLNNQTCAYELFYKINLKVPDDLKEEEKNKQIVKLMKNYISDTKLALFKNKKVFIKFTPVLLCGDIPYGFSPEQLVVEISLDMLKKEDVLKKIFVLKSNGYKICLCDFYYNENHKELFKFADIIKFSISGNYNDINITVEKCKETDKEAFAFEVETGEQYELAKDFGCAYIQGYFFAKPVMEEKKSGVPMVRTFLQILALLYLPDPNIEQISAVISTDPVLTIRLLRLINQMCEDTGNTISTVHQALVMLGIDRLKEWVYIVGLQRLNRNAPNELLKLALFRASFCERLAKITPSLKVKSKELYLMGLISIVTGTNSATLMDVLDSLPISDEIKAGIIGQGGVFSAIYGICVSYERGVWDEFISFAAEAKINTESVASQYLSAINYLDINIKF